MTTANPNASLLEMADQALNADDDHLDPAKCSDADREWLIAQLACWPNRVDENCTTNIRFLIMSAAAFIRAREDAGNG